MQIDFRSIWRTIGKFIAQTDLVKLPVLTAAEQTKRSWARVVDSYDELPLNYREFFDTLLLSTPSFPYTILTPTFEGFLRRENEKLVCQPDQAILILEKVRNNLVCTSYRLADISYIEMGIILLQAWITLRGVAGDGQLTTSTLKFNAVTDYLFTPIVKKIRAGTHQAAGPDLRSELSKFDHLGKLNFKFMNFARNSLMPDEKVSCTLLQPEIRRKLLTLLGRSFYRTVSPAHLSILTDRELIIIRDDDSPTWSQGIRYGGIWHYIPLNKIVSVSLAAAADNLLGLSIHLPGNDHLDFLFAAGNRQEVELFVNRLSGCTGGAARTGQGHNGTGQSFSRDHQPLPH